MNAMNRGQPIRNAQIALRALAKEHPEMDPGEPDGHFGAQTKSAVLSFQRSAGLTENGEIDGATWDLLIDAYRTSRAQSRPPAPVVIPWTGVLTAGTAHDAVLVVQLMLNRLARTFTNFPALTLTGVLDPPTADAVRRFQSAAMMPETGTVDPELWRKMGRASMHADPG